MEQYLNNFKNCLQKEIPYCAAGCPFHMDVPDFIEKMKRNAFTGAYKSYRNAVGFPRIASALCYEPCKEVCPGKENGSAIELLLLEKACIAHAGDRSPTDYNLPGKKRKVAVIGAGISGLACALRLCMKKYDVEIFEASGRLGGYLWELMDSETFLSDIKKQFLHENYVIHFNTAIGKPEDLEGHGFEAVYVATGDGGEDFGLLKAAPSSAEDGYCARYETAGWFAGGGLTGEKPVVALANGLYMATVIDNYLKTGTLRNPPNIRETRVRTDPAKMKFEPAVVPADKTGYNEQEAGKEAARCLECRCDFCRTYCDLTDFYNKWPLRIRDEVMATILPGKADIKATPAKRLLSTCSQCGICEEVCPEEIDLGGLILEGRKSMHRQKKMPWAFHDFFLRDMTFANGASAALTLAPAGTPQYVFFPGCQLGASDPELVEKTYRYLRDKEPETGLILRCCGAPAEWAGDEEKVGEETEALRIIWQDMGKPTLIMACPTCVKKFKTYLPELPVTSLYEIIAGWGCEALGEGGHVSPADTGGSTCGNPATTWSVFDACAARHEVEMKAAVKKLAQNAGCRLEPLPGHEAVPQCCSFGGQPGIANPEYTEFVVQKRISESPNPYITYCINCRDAFIDAGKKAVHILDLIFRDGASPKGLATVSQRRENRIKLKKRLEKEHKGCGPETETAGDTKKAPRDRIIHISGELAAKLNQERILEEEVYEVLEFCERTGRRVSHPEKGTYSGCGQIGHMTYWLEYRLPEPENEAGRIGGTGKSPRTYELVNAYVHRMKIELEPVWDGKIVEQNL